MIVAVEVLRHIERGGPVSATGQREVQGSAAQALGLQVMVTTEEGAHAWNTGRKDGAGLTGWASATLQQRLCWSWLEVCKGQR